MVMMIDPDSGQIVHEGHCAGTLHLGGKTKLKITGGTNGIEHVDLGRFVVLPLNSPTCHFSAET